MRPFFTSLFVRKFARLFLMIFVQLGFVVSILGATNILHVQALDRVLDQSELSVSLATISDGCPTNMKGKFLQRVSQVFTVYLPVVERTISPKDDGQVAIDRVNYYRSLAGVSPVQQNDAIIDAAQNHANYYLNNFADPTAWEFGFHSEVGGKPGFTGQWPKDRMEAADYPWYGSAEVMHFLGDPAASVDEWIASVYHRVILLEPTITCGGYGSGKNDQTAVDVLNLGIGDKGESLLVTTTPYPLAFPGDGQQGVPVAWNGNESPDPLPPYATRPAGFPFTLQGVMGKLVVDWAEMRNSEGQVIPVHPNPSLCSEFNCYALIPIQPLSTWSSYTVSAQGSVAGVAFNISWTFMTGDGTLTGSFFGLTSE